MSNIKLTFNPKNTSKYIKTARKLASKLNAYKSENNISFLVVEVKKDDVDKDFRSLFNHVIDLEDTTIELDNVIVEDTYQFRHVINCRYLNSNTHCYGICRMMNPELDRVFGAIGIFDRVGKLESFHPGDGLLNAGYAVVDYAVVNYAVADYAVVNDDNEILVNKHKLHERFLDDTKLQRRICHKYNMELVKEKFRELPGLVPLIFTDENTEGSVVEEECDVKGIEEEFEKDSYNLNEDIVARIGDEFEKRLRKVLDEYFRNGK